MDSSVLLLSLSLPSGPASAAGLWLWVRSHRRRSRDRWLYPCTWWFRRNNSSVGNRRSPAWRQGEDPVCKTVTAAVQWETVYVKVGKGNRGSSGDILILSGEMRLSWMGTFRTPALQKSCPKKGHTPRRILMLSLYKRVTLHLYCTETCVCLIICRKSQIFVCLLSQPMVQILWKVLVSRRQICLFICTVIWAQGVMHAEVQPILVYVFSFEIGSH